MPVYGLSPSVAIISRSSWESFGRETLRSTYLSVSSDLGMRSIWGVDWDIIVV